MLNSAKFNFNQSMFPWIYIEFLDMGICPVPSDKSYRHIYIHTVHLLNFQEYISYFHAILISHKHSLPSHMLSKCQFE